MLKIEPGAAFCPALIVYCTLMAGESADMWDVGGWL